MKNHVVARQETTW